ncbi:MAG: LamG domain-containing protein, partial [Chloroflexota bacterium]
AEVALLGGARVRVAVGSGTYVPATQASLSGVDGSTATENLSANLVLAHSYGPTEPRNAVEFTIQDMGGNVARSSYPVFVNLNPALPPTALSPDDAAQSVASLTRFSWSLDAQIPSQVIEDYSLQVAHDLSFSSPVIDLSTTALSFEALLEDGRYYWRVAAGDKFGSLSPYSPTRSLLIDTEPPVVTMPEVALSGGGFVPIETVLGSTVADARIRVQDMTSGLAGYTAGTPMGRVGFWRFEGDFTDSSGMGNNLSPQGGAMTSALEKRFGAQAYFNDNTGGRRGYIDTLAGFQGGIDQSVTLSAWARLGNTTPLHPGDGIIGLGTPYPGIRLYVRAGNLGGVNCAAGQLQLAVTADIPTDRWMCAGSLQAGQWYHFAVVYDATSKVIKAYVDGVLGSSTTLASGLNLGRSIEIGGDLYNDNWLDGYVDDAAIYGRALNETEVSILARPGGRLLARLSTDGGASYWPVYSSSGVITGTQGSTSLERIELGGLELAHSFSPSSPRNMIQFLASDLAGNESSSTQTVLVNLNQTLSPITQFPANGQGFKESPGRAAWTLDPQIPAAAIASFNIDLSKDDPSFAAPLLSLNTTSYTAELPSNLTSGAYYWRVRANDNFGTSSPYGVFRFSIDQEPPVLSNPQVAVSGSGQFNPITTPTSSSLVTVRINAQDTVSGLDVTQDRALVRDGLIGFWRFEGDFTDSSGMGNHLTAQGGAVTSGIQKRFGAQAYYNTAAARRGYIQELAGYPGGNQSVTLSAWAYLPGAIPLHPGDGVIGLGSAAAGLRLYTRLGNLGGPGCVPGQLQLAVTADTPADRWVCAGSSLQPGHWYHVAAVYDDDN